MMMTLWRFLAAKKVAVEARAGDAADRARPPSGNARPRRIGSVDFDCSSAVEYVAGQTHRLSTLPPVVETITPGCQVVIPHDRCDKSAQAPSLHIDDGRLISRVSPPIFKALPQHKSLGLRSSVPRCAEGKNYGTISLPESRIHRLSPSAYRPYCVFSFPGSSLFEAHGNEPPNVPQFGLTSRPSHLLIGLVHAPRLGCLNNKRDCHFRYVNIGRCFLSFQQ